MDPYKYVPSDEYDTENWTTNAGAPVWNNEATFSVGLRGPLLLEDYHFIEKMSNFDRERIPERVVHAVGATAKGYFECTADVTHLTVNDVFRSVGARTPLITRFSTVVHPRGSPETLRDPRGFAVKFYTRQGIWDLVGNNFDVFFIRDAMKFPDLVHAFKPNPVSNLQETWRIFDFLSHHPESANMLTRLFADRGIPANYRQMPGFGVHAFKLINRDGKETLVKFHWKSQQGEEFLLEEDAIRVGGTNHQHAQADLFEAIEAGNYPEWTLHIQTMEPEDVNKLDFDPLDVTKIWPEDLYPLQEIGRMVLNQNPDSFFHENEQVAFCPSQMVPGIAPSEDKLLQGRLFSYADTQRHRLGGNYLLLPVNAPKNRYRNSHHDGAGNFMRRTGEVNYFPSRIQAARNTPADVATVSSEEIVGQRTRQVIDKENNFTQPGQRWRSFGDAEKERFVVRIADALADPELKPEVRRIWIDNWTRCDEELGRRISRALESRLRA